MDSQQLKRSTQKITRTPGRKRAKTGVNSGKNNHALSTERTQCKTTHNHHWGPLTLFHPAKGHASPPFFDERSIDSWRLLKGTISWWKYSDTHPNRSTAPTAITDYMRHLGLLRNEFHRIMVQWFHAFYQTSNEKSTTFHRERTWTWQPK